MHDAAAIKNARGDNSQVFSKKETGNVYQKMKRDKKGSLINGEKRDDPNLKVVPLHINDVIDALKYVKRSSLTSIIQNCNRMKLENSDTGKLSARYRKFHDYEEIPDTDENRYADKESIISDFVEELNIRYIRKCESDVRRRKMKRRKAVGQWQPKRRSQPLIRNTKLSEKGTPARKRFSNFKSGDKSSLTGLSFLSPEPNEHQRQIGNKLDSKYRKKEQKFKVGDFDRDHAISDVSSWRGKKINSKSYTASKEKDTYGYPKEKRYSYAGGVYSSKSQENTYKIATTKKKILRKNRELGRRERPISSKKGKPKVGRDNSWSSGEKLHENMKQNLKETRQGDRLENEKTGKFSFKETLEGGEELKRSNEIFGKLSATNEGKTLSGKCLAEIPVRSFKDCGENNQNAFSIFNYNYKSREVVQSNNYIDNYKNIMLSNSTAQNENENTNNFMESQNKMNDRINSDMTDQFKFQANLEKNFQANEMASKPRGSDSTLIKQNSKIIIKVQMSQTRMQGTVRDPHYLTEKQESGEVEHLTDSCSVNIIPSDTFNKRYRKNRLNGNFGILSRISVPDFHQKEVLTEKNFERPKPNRSRLTQKVSKDKPSNDPLKNIMLTQLVRQNSSISLHEECKVDVKTKYLMGALSSDTFSHPMNISDICSSQDPNLAPLSDPISYATETLRNEDSDSSLSESVIIETMSRKQSETKNRWCKNRTGGYKDQHIDESTDNKTYYQRSGLACNTRKMHSANKNRTCRHKPRKHAERRQKSPEKSPSNDESTAYPANEDDTEEVSLKVDLRSRKCAVEGCNKHAVLDTEQKSKHYSCSPMDGNNEETYTQKKKLDSASTHKMCILCTAPITEQNTSGGQPSDSLNKHFFPENNFQLPENLVSHQVNGVPYFTSPSQEDFQQYLTKMRRCFSTQHPSLHTPMKKYHSLPITTPIARNSSPDKYYPPNYWEPNDCAHVQAKCVNTPFGNTDNFVYYCTENTGATVDYMQTNMNFEQFPFMQSTGPLMDTSGRPLLILDENGQPILDYNGQPITPDTYAQVEYQYDPGFEILNDDSSIQEEINHTKKFSYFGFH